MRRLMFEQDRCQKTGQEASTQEYSSFPATKTACPPELWFLFVWRWAVGVLGWWRWLGLGRTDPLRLLRRALVVSLLGESTSRHCAYDYQDKQLSN
jgi:hypothetical protein